MSFGNWMVEGVSTCMPVPIAAMHMIRATPAENPVAQETFYFHRSCVKLSN